MLSLMFLFSSFAKADNAIVPTLYQLLLVSRCDSTHLELCTTETACTGVGGYWWPDDSCHDEEAASCDSTHLELCTTEITCTGAGGYWWTDDNSCYGTVEPSSTNQVWMDRNLGASRVATSSDDTLAYGDLYQWGRGSDGHEKRDSGTTSDNATSNTPGHADFITESESPYDWRTPQNDNLWQGVSGINNPCPSGFRLPTQEELETEITDLSITNAETAFTSPLKLVVAGARSRETGSIINEDSYGFYWSSTVDGTDSLNLYITGGNVYVENSSHRAYGLSVRCIKD